jgi:hypothetical protein
MGSVLRRCSLNAATPSHANPVPAVLPVPLVPPNASTMERCALCAVAPTLGSGSGLSFCLCGMLSTEAGSTGS